MKPISGINGGLTPSAAEQKNWGDFMHRIPRVRQVLVAAGIGSLLLTSSIVAGAASTTGTYNAADAKLVPASYKNVTLQVATDATYAPDESMKGTTMVGFDVDLMKAVATTLKLKINENNVTFDSIIAGVTSGRYQVGNSSFTDNKAREKSVNFVDYFQAGEGVYAKSNSTLKFKGFKSFCGWKVAVEKGTVEQTDAQTAAKACSKSKKLTVITFPNQTEANLAVLSGQANVGFVDSQIAGYIASTSKGQFKLLGSAVNVAPYGIATSKTTAGDGLAMAIQAALKTLIANGTYKAILTKWGVASGGLAAAKIVLNGAIS
jgi:polar amino acid transport system substrate-binding protein